VPVFNKGERSVRHRPWAALLVVFIWTTIAAFWFAGERAEWSPDFSAKPLPAAVLGNATPADIEGARLFHDKGCEFCHAIQGYGGKRGPDLTLVGGRMTSDQIVARITNGSASMPAYTRMLEPEEVQTLAEFLARRR
jgi:ubiquinol-cytochrome c reductase cytochrome b subunit